MKWDDTDASSKALKSASTQFKNEPKISVRQTWVNSRMAFKTNLPPHSLKFCHTLENKHSCPTTFARVH